MAVSDVKTPITSSAVKDNAWLIGVFAFLFGITCASIQSGISKSLTTTLPVGVIVWCRFFIIFTVCMPLALATHSTAFKRPQRPTLQLLRGVLLLGAGVAFVAATERMPLADAVSVLFVYPFLMTAVGAWFFKERVGPLGWIAVTLGFIGVLIVMRPGTEGGSPYAFLALIAGGCFATVLMISRFISQLSPVIVTAAWTAGTAAILLSLAVPLFWKTPSATESWLLLLIGLFSIASQLAVTYSCKKASMAVLAPFGYFEIVIATLIGFFMFGDVPDVIGWIGIMVIVASGLLIAMLTHRGSKKELEHQTD